MSDKPFYPLDPYGEPMYCACDHSTVCLADLCPKCPHRPEHRDAALADLDQQIEELKRSGDWP